MIEYKHFLIDSIKSVAEKELEKPEEDVQILF